MLFRSSQTPFVSAVQQIADAAGASSDGEQTTRAGVSLNAAIGHFNNRYKWNWLQMEADPIAVIAPFTVLGVSASGNIASAACVSGHGLKVDDFISGSGFAPNSRVTATAAAGFGFSPALTGFSGATGTFSVTAIRDCYDLPADWKVAFSVRLANHTSALRPVNRRLYDRGITNEMTTGSETGYDTFLVGGKGKIRLLPPPSTSDTLILRYNRAMATAVSGSTASVDIPADYETYLISWAKWHFLTDKGEGRKDQATAWMALAKEGLVTMLAEQTNQPDQELGFIPGHAVASVGSDDKSTANIVWDH
jgi:hypothetical protein